MACTGQGLLQPTNVRADWYWMIRAFADAEVSLRLMTDSPGYC